jgi:hypothetical protein
MLLRINDRLIHEMEFSLPNFGTFLGSIREHHCMLHDWWWQYKYRAWILVLECRLTMSHSCHVGLKRARTSALDAKWLGSDALAGTICRCITRSVIFSSRSLRLHCRDGVVPMCAESEGHILMISARSGRCNEYIRRSADIMNYGNKLGCAIRNQSTWFLAP